MMTFDEIMAEISVLLGVIDNEPKDAHESYLKLHGKLNELRALGEAVPEDLARLEKELEAAFTAEQNSRGVR